MTDEECSPDELRTLFLFEKLTDAQLEWLCQRGRVEVIPAGPVYAEGDPATHFYVPAGPGPLPGRRPVRAAGQHAGDAGGKIPPGIRVVKEYDRSLPAIPAYASS